MRAALRDYADDLSHAADSHHGAEMADVRTAQHAGHEIVVRTSYEVTVDGVPFNVHLSVANNGRVHYHGLPTRDFPSVIDLVAKAIDSFGDDLTTPENTETGGHEHSHEHGHEHGAGGEH